MSSYGVWKRWSTVCSCHGVPDMFQSKHFVGKLFWLILIIFAFSQIIIQTRTFIKPMVDAWGGKYQFETEVSYDPAEDGMSLPRVAICNIQQFNVTKLYSLINITHDRIKEFVFNGLVFLESQYPEKKKFQRALRDYKQFYDNETSSLGAFKDMQDLIQNITMNNCRGLIISCVDSQDEMNKLDCCRSDVMRIGFSRDKVCSVLDLTNPYFRKRYSPGAAQSFRLSLDPGYRHTKGLPVATVAEGFHLYLSYDQSDYFITTDPVFLLTGTRTFVSMSQVRHTQKMQHGTWKFLYDPKPECTTDQKLKVMTGRYSEAACFADCFYAGMIQFCGRNCSLIGPIRPEIRRCSTDETYQCIRKYNRDINENPNKTIKDARAMKFMECPCTKPCEYTNIETSSSSTRIGHRMYESMKTDVNRTGQFPDKKSIQDLTEVDLYFSTNLRQLVELRARVTVDELISQVGGSMGVWAGVSILTLVQFAVYFVTWLFGFVDSQPQGSQQSERRQQSSSLQRSQRRRPAEHHQQHMELPSTHSMGGSRLHAEEEVEASAVRVAARQDRNNNRTDDEKKRQKSTAAVIINNDANGKKKNTKKKPHVQQSTAAAAAVATAAEAEMMYGNEYNNRNQQQQQHQHQQYSSGSIWHTQHVFAQHVSDAAAANDEKRLTSSSIRRKPIMRSVIRRFSRSNY